MYKVYINETPLRLISQKKMERHGLVSDEENLVTRYAGRSKFLLNYIDMLEKTQRYQSITIYSVDKKKLIHDFESLFQVIEAAGGLVFNPEGKALVIYRRDFWDLPKGKIDKGEGKKEAAVREVKEETGLKNVDLEDFICETNHVYKDKKKRRCIKRTYWYKMRTKDEKLTPQTEEDIEVAKWAKLNMFISKKPKIYKNILEVIQAYHRMD
ncbi:MAG: NUDIX domain-containing protein [Bacteroidota bacterium]